MWSKVRGRREPVWMSVRQIPGWMREQEKDRKRERDHMQCYPSDRDRSGDLRHMKPELCRGVEVQTLPAASLATPREAI